VVNCCSLRHSAAVVLYLHRGTQFIATFDATGELLQVQDEQILGRLEAQGLPHLHDVMSFPYPHQYYDLLLLENHTRRLAERMSVCNCCDEMPLLS